MVEPDIVALMRGFRDAYHKMDKFRYQLLLDRPETDPSRFLGAGGSDHLRPGMNDAVLVLAVSATRPDGRSIEWSLDFGVINEMLRVNADVGIDDPAELGVEFLWSNTIDADNTEDFIAAINELVDLLVDRRHFLDMDLGPEDFNPEPGDS